MVDLRALVIIGNEAIIMTYKSLIFQYFMMIDDSGVIRVINNPSLRSNRTIHNFNSGC